MWEMKIHEEESQVQTGFITEVLMALFWVGIVECRQHQW